MTWGEDYVALVLRLEKYFEGFVDAYCGPPEVKARIEKEEKKPLDNLFSDAEHLYGTVPAEDTPRRIFLEKQLTGIKTTIEVLQGKEIDYTEQVRLFFDIKPEKVPDSIFETQKQVLQDIFKGQNLTEALEKWRKRTEIGGDLLQRTIAVLHDECRKRTNPLLDLPEGEHVDFVLVTDKPWGGYNWYLGNYTSRVEINTDIPVQVTGLPSLISHEAYPGHHTEHSMKEKTLYRGKNFLDACVFVYNTPECLISEGIANNAFDMIFKDKPEVYNLLRERTGLTLDPEKDAIISNALNKFSACSGNASLMIHQEHTGIPDAVDYLVDVGLLTRERAEKQIEFMTNPLFSAYIFNYYVGKEVVSKALEHVGLRVFYEHQLCPSNISYFKS
jgi:hypothetical protein